MKKILIFVLVLFVFSNCKPIAKMKLHVKNPKFKNMSELYFFTKKHDVNLNSIYYFESWEKMTTALNLKYSSIPNAYFFNKKGDFVSYKKTTNDCNAKVDDFIENLENFSTNQSDSLRNINQVLASIKNDKNDKIKQGDITILITWASFLGDVNKDKAFEWIKLLENAKNKGIKVEYYLINYDLQKSWNLSESKEKEIEKLFKI